MEENKTANKKMNNLSIWIIIGCIFIGLTTVFTLYFYNKKKENDLWQKKLLRYEQKGKENDLKNKRAHEITEKYQYLKKRTIRSRKQEDKFLKEIDDLGFKPYTVKESDIRDHVIGSQLETEITYRKDEGEYYTILTIMVFKDNSCDIVVETFYN